MLSDVVLQEIPWRKAVREAVKNGRLPLWNRSVLAGEPLLAVQQPAFLHPATWIGFLLPLAQAWTFEMALRYFLALLCGYLFLRDLACGQIAALLGAVRMGVLRLHGLLPRLSADSRGGSVPAAAPRTAASRSRRETGARWD